MTKMLSAEAAIVQDLGKALRSAKHGLECTPGLLKRVLREESWRSFATEHGELVEHNDFATFVTAEPPQGLGGGVDLLWRLIEDDPEAAELLGQALADGSGRTAQIPVDDPDAVAEELRKHMSPEDLRRLVLLLAD